MLIPWTYGLARDLPTDELAQHWSTAWVGFDIFILCLLVCTTVLAIKRAIWLALAATSLSTLLVIDAWFDVLTSNPGHDQLIALGFAAFIELPLAVFTYLLAHGSIIHLHRDIKNLQEPLTSPVSTPHKQSTRSAE